MSALAGVDDLLPRGCPIGTTATGGGDHGAGQPHFSELPLPPALGGAAQPTLTVVTAA
jgi:hypothetical protein